jgi:iron(III) transport system permease protein
MISCLTLERPGKWRAIGVTTILSIVMLPAVPLLWHAILSLDSVSAFVGDAVGGAFGGALLNSIMVALLVAVVSLVVGMPTGVLAALYEFSGRRVLLALTVLPLLVPSFLLAIGWSSLTARFKLTAALLVTGVPGCVLVFSAAAIALVLLVSLATTTTLSGSQIDAARLAGGERTVLVHASRHVATPALLAAGLGGVLTLSDPGPGQILGLRTAASEILTSFASLYDFALAGRQCVALALLVLIVAVPLAFFSAPRLASEILARQSRNAQRVRHRGIARVAVTAFVFLVVIGTMTPLIGLLLPLSNGNVLSRAWQELSLTTFNTLLYAMGAGVVAAALGFLLAVCVGRNAQLRTIVIGVVLALFSLPPALAALGLVQIAATVPPWADPFLRGRLTVCVALGLRFFPIAAILGLRAWGSTSATWALAAAVHGVSVITYLWRVLLPLLLPVSAVAMLLVALLATADISTVLLLHPPGERSLPLAIFTVMANAPESLVASLCLVYVGTAAILLVAMWALVSREKR